MRLFLDGVALNITDLHQSINQIYIAHFEQIKMLQKICNKITIKIKQIGRDCSFNEVEIKTH